MTARRPVTGIAEAVLRATARMCDEVDVLSFATPVAVVYNPLRYAWDLHADYVRQYGDSRRRVLLLGMNPGPWGMAQTGVPFGEVSSVRDWLQLRGNVGHPPVEHPKRPVQGLACPRSEVSGRRLWGFFAEKYGQPADFFIEHFVINYCPLVFMEESARNRTPDKLPANEREPLFAACDRRLLELVDLYEPQWVVGVGGFARKKLDSLYGKRAQLGAGSEHHLPGRIGTLLHPSPASPAANKGWSEAAARQLKEQEIWI